MEERQRLRPQTSSGVGDCWEMPPIAAGRVYTTIVFLIIPSILSIPCLEEGAAV